MKAIKRFLGALLLACVGCATVTPTPAPYDGTDYTMVCQHLAELGCAEGKAPECAVAFGRFQGGRMSDLQPSCLMASKTPEAARACGSVLCE